MKHFNLTLMQKITVCISSTAQKMKFSITDFFSKCDQIRIWSHLPKKSVMENLIFCAVILYIHGPGLSKNFLKRFIVLGSEHLLVSSATL